MGNNVARLLVLDQDSQEIRDSQAAIAALLDKEDAAKEILGDLPAIDAQIERCEKGAQLFADCEDMMSLAKELEGVLSRVRRRMAAVQEVVRQGLEEEAREAGGEIETANWAIKIRKNPAKVIVDDLQEVPRKYRLEPKPIPEWTEWDVDKNLVKQALTKEKVRSIVGVHIEQAERVEIKPR